MILSWPRPISSARAAERIPLSTMASRSTSLAPLGFSRLAFASMRSVRRRWSREPQFTPIRTGLSYSSATSMIFVKFASRCLVPTFPGLIRYFASAAAVSGNFVRSRCPL